ncbi:hypothetical protein [Acidovorax sp. SUPP3334]|uniref:hypothetical protein n=1 Tax=Acidovorax sp. SUPP3334 TaxID=2920881 RepID=UPI0023DE44CA|nr:hypothetical protein [Acidovorax sp. SUPP3334]GKT22553.1 hypothetical protein AVHM3334_08810 [Acidovorax sp. SUPP3334]
MPAYLTTITHTGGAQDRHLGVFDDAVIAAQQMARQCPAAQRICVETYSSWKARQQAAPSVRNTESVQHNTHSLPSDGLVFAPGVVEAFEPAASRSWGCYAAVLAAVLALTIGLAMLLGYVNVRGLPL